MIRNDSIDADNPPSPSAAHRVNRGMVDVALRTPRWLKRMIVFALDVLLCGLTVWLAFYLRLGDWVPLRGNQWIAVLASVVLAIPVFVVSGMYRAIFRYSGAAVLTTIAQASIVYGVGYATLITIVQIETIPRTVGIIQPVLLFLFVAASRLMAGWWLIGPDARTGRRTKRPASLIYGAGSAGRQLYQALAMMRMRVVGFVDDDPRLRGQLLFGLPVYSPGDLEGLAERSAIADILLAIPSAGRTRRAEIIERLRPVGIAVRTMPDLTDVVQGKVQISDIRELDLDDLLGRQAVEPDPELLARNIRGKTVLVTGAGGSIGSELCRQILANEPQRLLLVEIGEPALYAIHQELEVRVAEQGRVEIVPLLASVTDTERMRRIVETWRPQTIYHAAAYKHVPLVEHNCAPGVLNNVFGTLVTATAARDFGVSDFVFVSTDKAVRPTNVMGATKRLAEEVLQALAAVESGTRFSMVRFGNVLGSSGSVVPLFRRQIQAGGPITITHSEITRYFMTIPEAAQLVIQAAAMAGGGEVFVLDMGEPVRIVDLARTMIELSGLRLRDADTPDGDIAIEVVGLRPGEKLYEELLIGNDPAPTPHPRIMKASEHFMGWDTLEQHLRVVRQAIANEDIDLLRAQLLLLVPEYEPKNDPVDFVHLRRRSDEAPVAD